MNPFDYIPLKEAEKHVIQSHKMGIVVGYVHALLEISVSFLFIVAAIKLL